MSGCHFCFIFGKSRVQIATRLWGTLDELFRDFHHPLEAKHGNSILY